MVKLGTLISLKELLEAIGRSQPKYLRILDTSFQKQSVRNYLNEHVPGALFFDLNECRDKSSKYNVMLPSPTMFENYVGNLGIRNDTHVVLYETMILDSIQPLGFGGLLGCLVMKKSLF